MFEAFILAGGRSQRLGLEKPIVELNGEALVRIANTTLLEAKAKETTVVCGSKAELFRPVLGDLNLVDDLRPNLGAIGGIYTALEESHVEDVFVVACDFPFLTPEFIEYLGRRFVESEVDALVPMQPDGYKQPLCAFYRKSGCSLPLKSLLAESEYAPSPRDLLDKVDTEYAEFEEFSHLQGADRFFININTPGDLESARNMLRA